MSIRLLMFLAGGTVLMLPVMLFTFVKYAFPIGKGVLATGLLTVSGLLAVKLMFFIENGRFGGESFFGAVFFVPLFFYLVSKLLKLRYDYLLDASAPAICIMLTFMKARCMISRCCGGKFLYLNELEVPVYFPSREAELSAAFLLAVFLIFVIHRQRQKGRVYPWFMILYGAIRFALNWMRYTRENFIWILPAGNFWGIISVIIGVAWLLFLSVHKKRHLTQNVVDQK